MGVLTLDEITEKMIKLENELTSLRNRNFSKFFMFDIKKKELELNKLSEMRGKLLAPENFLAKFSQDRIRLYVPSCYKNLGKILGHTCSRMRVSMADNWGFMVPVVRILDKDDLKCDEFEVEFRGGVQSTIFKINPDLPQNELCNSIIAKFQSYLFDRADLFLSVLDMFLYVKAAQLNESEKLQELAFWREYSDWFAYNLGYILVPLLSERYCVKNISYILDYVYSQIIYEGKNKDFVLSELRKKLKKYPEALFVSSWTLKNND